MGKHYFSLSNLWLVLIWVLSALGPGRAQAADDGVTLYGSVINMGEGINGIYSFNTTQPGVFNPIKLNEGLSAQGGGVLAGDCFYSIHADDKTLHVYDVDVWGERYSMKMTNVSLGMTYDPTTQQVYGCFVDNGPQLGVLVPEKGTYRKIATFQMPISVMVCTQKGELFAVGADGYLYRVNKETAEMTEVGSTDSYPMFAQSAVVDPNTGTCYWAAMFPDFTSGLYELDLATGKTTKIYDFPNSQEVTGLFILPEAKAATPAEALNLRREVQADGKEAACFTAPVKTVDGKVLPQTELDYTVQVFAEETGVATVDSAKAMPGDEVCYVLPQNKGMVKVTVTFRNAAGEGKRAFLYFWMGVDRAAAVTDLTVEKQSRTTVKLSWTAPTEGEHGGAFDASTLRYKVVRHPDEKVLYTAYKGVSLLDEVADTQLKKYWYDVTPLTAAATEGVGAASEKVLLGNPYELPYVETFGEMGGPGVPDQFDLYTVLDRNGDEDTWFYDSFMGNVKFAGFSPETADDWLFTPPVHIPAGAICHFSFSVQVGIFSVHKLEVAMGNSPTVEGMEMQLMEETSFETMDSNERQQVTVRLIAAQEGDYYVGVHLVSDGQSMDLALDDFSVVQKAHMEAPNEVSDLKVVPDGKGALEAEISFVAPTTTFSGAELQKLEKIEVYRNEERIKTFEQVKAGAACTLVDTPAQDGLYVYKVVAYSDQGAGVERNEKVFVGVDVPGAVQNITMEEALDGVVTVRWEAPVVGKNGGYIEKDDLTYSVFRNGWKEVGLDVKECTVQDAMKDLAAGTQNVVQYQVKVKSAAGEGMDAYSSFITAGTAFETPFVESFPMGQATYLPWSTFPQMNGCLWRYDFFADGGPVDNDSGMLAFSTVNTKPTHSMLLSPKVRVDNTKKPVLNFWYYNSAIEDDLVVEVWVDNQSAAVVKTLSLRTEAEGWQSCSIDLSAYKDNHAIQFAFHVNNVLKNDKLYIDQLAIVDDLDFNLAAGGLVVPARVTVGDEQKMNVTVFNYGKEVVEDFTVSFYNGEELLETVGGNILGPGESLVAWSALTPQVADLYEMDIWAQVNLESDQNLQNNATERVKVDILPPPYPAVTDLIGRTSPQGNVLNWSAPDLSALKPLSVLEDFETYEPFTIENFGDWTLVDVDQNAYSMEFRTNQNEWITYPNSGGKMSFQIIDLTQINATPEDGWNSVSGDYILICPYSSENNDWLISPELYPTEQEISINAKSLAAGGYGLEGFTVLYSTTDKKTTSFQVLKEEKEVPADWTLYKVTLPADAKYFAIQAKSINSALFLDDITYIPVSSKPLQLSLTGYHVYRDRARLNEAPVAEPVFTDAEAENRKEYTYEVTVAYDLGESGFSNEVVVATDTHLEEQRLEVKVYAADRQLVVLGADGERVLVSDVNGAILTEVIGERETVVPVPAGVFLVKIGAKVFKVLVP